MIIFVTGAHGVGKSTICSKLAEKYDFKHLIASDLIKRGLPIQNWSTDKIVDGPKKNQEILIRELDFERKAAHKVILLDGHTVLKVKDGYHRIDYSYINRISPLGIVLIDCSPEDVLCRDGSRYYSSMKEVENMMLEEDFTSENLSNALKIPRLKINTSKDVSYENINIFIEGLAKNDRPKL